jgi:hypothetical protein
LLEVDNVAQQTVAIPGYVLGPGISLSVSTSAILDGWYLTISALNDSSSKLLFAFLISTGLMVSVREPPRPERLLICPILISVHVGDEDRLYHLDTVRASGSHWIFLHPLHLARVPGL